MRIALLVFLAYWGGAAILVSQEKEAKPAAAPDLTAIPLIGDVQTPEDAGLRRISKTERIWVDLKNKRVVIDGAIALTDGPLEMFACPRRTKEHESVVGVECKSSTAHAALLAIGAKEGHPVRYDPKYEPATGTEIDVYVLWKDADGKRKEIRAQEWVRNAKTGKALEHPWVFGGSMFSRDEETKRSYYQADAGDFICVSNFPTAMMDLPIESSQDDSSRLFEAFAERIPPRGTPVRVVLIPKLENAEKPKAEKKEAEPPPAADKSP